MSLTSLKSFDVVRRYYMYIYNNEDGPNVAHLLECGKVIIYIYILFNMHNYSPCHVRVEAVEVAYR